MLQSATRFIIAAALFLVLSACGFRPMYGTAQNSDSPSVVMMLSGVKMGDVVAVKSSEDDNRRLTQLVRNRLLDRLDATGPGTPNYQLDVRINLDSEGVGFRPDEAVTRVNMQLDADYILTDLATGKPVYSGTARAFNAYDVVRSDFATLSARQDTERRLVPEITDQIMTRLGLYFKNRDRIVPENEQKKSPETTP